ncbi:MAG: hypothetical protein EF813_02010 [Methanosarcinales archaeon]|nr:MAG: hypothetical protein EF813_02010 [Methanosarcinales archaeon]
MNPNVRAGVIYLIDWWEKKGWNCMVDLRENVDVMMENISSVLSLELEKIKDASNEDSAPVRG